MGALRKNDKAYHESAISDMKGFHNTSFLLQAGSGDDNVHFLVSLIDPSFGMCKADNSMLQ